MPGLSLIYLSSLSLPRLGSSDGLYCGRVTSWDWSSVLRGTPPRQSVRYPDLFLVKRSCLVRNIEGVHSADSRDRVRVHCVVEAIMSKHIAGEVATIWVLAHGEGVRVPVISPSHGTLLRTTRLLLLRLCWGLRNGDISRAAFIRPLILSFLLLRWWPSRLLRFLLSFRIVVI